MPGLAVETQFQVLPLAEYARQLEASGIRISQGSPGTFWMAYEKGSFVRMPTFALFPPDTSEIGRLFRRWAGMAGYLVKPSERHPPNVWWYVCEDAGFRLEKLSSPARRDIRRAQRCFEFRPVSKDQALACGAAAFADTRTRVGLSDGTVTHFRERMATHFANPAHHAVGAWKGDELAAFATLIAVEDWIEVTGVFSGNAHLRDCPNNGLIHHIQLTSLVGGGKRLVSYGLSSVQEDTSEAGLHAFKLKAGFEARPVCRVFVLHPLLRPFANRTILKALRLVLKQYPANRYLRKAVGSLMVVLEMRKLPPSNAEPVEIPVKS